MRVIKSETIRYVLISLKFYRILYDFYGNTYHGSNLGHNIFTHGFGSITVPFVALSIFHDTRLSFVNNLSLIDSLFQHFIGIIFNFLCGRFDNFLFCFFDNIFIGP